MVAQPGMKDTAEFLRWMMKLGWATVPEVVCWVESLIEKTDEPADWMLDFGWNKSAYHDEIDRLLEKVPGTFTDDLPRKMAAALIRERWLDGRVSDKQFISLWYALYPHYPEIAEMEYAADVWQYLDEIMIDLADGYKIPVSPQSARAQLATYLESYTAYSESAEHVLAELRRRVSHLT